ncbi:hypothetical protein LTR50_003934 [Elasticomyces elasticus]|nr:hypothetical protein LTR50_003934 [Elasticomyces elasticus]
MRCKLPEEGEESDEFFLSFEEERESSGKKESRNSHRETRACLISTALLASHLLSCHPTGATATVIDTTGTFDVLALHKALITRLRCRKKDNAQEPQVQVSNDDDIPAHAVEALQRVKISRVFDFVGVMEAVGEFEEAMTGGSQHRRQRSGTDDGVRNETRPRPRGTIGDSQAEGEDEDEMLNDLPTPRTQTTDATPARQDESAKDSEEEDMTGGMLVIDSLDHVVGPMTKRDYVQGQALLTSFLRSLNRVTETHGLLTLLLNAATTYGTGAAQGPSLQSAPGRHFDTPSVFASTALRPALGKTFPYFVDVSLLVSRLPRTARDAGMAYGDGDGKGASWVNVVEVLSDRYEGRVGRWACFVVDREGGLRDAF